MAGVDDDLGAGLGDLLAADLGDALLVRRIDVGEDRHDADRLDLVGDQRLRGGDDLMLVERQDDIAELVDALGDAMGAAARHQRIGMVMGHGMQPVGIGIVGPGLQAAAHQDHVLEALGGDQPEPAAGARQKRVEHAGAGIEHDVDAGKQRLPAKCPRRPRRPRPRRGSLRPRSSAWSPTLPILKWPSLIDKDRVGHGAAGVDADDDRVCR